MQHIDYAKSKSFATLKRDDPTFVPPNAVNAHQGPTQNGRITISSEKRQRDDDADDVGRQAKREKGDDEDDEEMEIDEDEDDRPSTITITSSTSLYLNISLVADFKNYFPESGRPVYFGTTNSTVTVYKSTSGGHR